MCLVWSCHFLSLCDHLFLFVTCLAISVLPADIRPEIFGEKLIEVLRRYGFGVLGKLQLEAAILHALMEASADF